MKTKILAIIAITMVLLTSGCGNSDYLQDSDGNIITNEETGQTLRKDILCKPKEDTDVYNIYKENEDQLSIKLDDLPECQDFNVSSNESNSLWDSIFVKPTAWAITSVGNLVGNLGIAVMIVGVLIRIILLPFQIKSSRQSHNMKKAQPEIQKLDTKYRNRTDRESQMAKSQEIMMIYRKYKVNPATGCLLAFVQIPVFFAFLNAIYRLPSIYEGTLLGWNLGTTPLTGIQNGNYTYIILLILVGVSTFFSFRYSMSQAPTMNQDSGKQMKMMMNFMMVIILISSLSFPAALHFYWITTYAFIAIQTYLIKYYLGDRKPKQEKPLKIKEKLIKKEGKKYGKDNN